ncbi:MAG: 1-acyl-sn-glycerol-3-phosphate acyltransferase [Calditrichaeota bacterium]|nr:1-acyl-sn-glycerol-3-phosphate acyltransferase [Calditrichota bacterium]RQV92983.1 MAG: 1-acyl-sn-glycerol-3-phosphate acyltransferase [bacterium]RQW08065.1 MAG: 1-acyl-sn-glycerol-3-phosphate acyltransferase [Calditrichota bacterium]
MLHLIFFIIIFVSATVFCAILAIFGGIFNPYSSYNTAVIRLWARISVIAAGVKLRIEGLENIRPENSYVVVANHQSHMDIPVINVALPNALRIIAKKELFTIPFLGWGMKAVGMLKIDRTNQKKSIETLKGAENIIRSCNLSILAFPEGTRSPDGKIHNFKKGPFIMAINTGIPVLPVSISGTRNIIPKGKIRINSGPVKIVIHPPIDTSRYTLENRNKLVQKTRNFIEKGFIENYGRSS